MINRKSPRLPRLNGKWYFSSHTYVVVVVVVVVVVNYCLSGTQLLNRVYSDINVYFLAKISFQIEDFQSMLD